MSEIAYNHLLILADRKALPLDDLDVMQATQDFVLDLELGRHGELGAFLNLEGLVLELGLCAFHGKIDGVRRSSFGIQ